MDTARNRFRDGSASAAHGVQIYAANGWLAESVATYLAAGFRAGEPAVVVATTERAAAFQERLGAFDGSLLLFADAASTLDLNDVEERFPDRRIRVFGEMIDLLSERGRPDVAAALEDLWTSLAERRRFSLLCAYRLDVFDRNAEVFVLTAVCRAHSHVRA